MDESSRFRHEIDGAEDEYNKNLDKDYRAQLKRLSVRLTKEELEARIKDFLKKHCICAIATCSHNIPRSTIVRYRSRDLTIYILTEGGGKTKNIKDNPEISVSVCGEYSGFQSVTCLQLWGHAEVIAPDNQPLYTEAYQAMNIEERQDLKELNVENMRKHLSIIKITTKRARYLSFPEGVLNQVLDVAGP